MGQGEVLARCVELHAADVHLLGHLGRELAHPAAEPLRLKRLVGPRVATEGFKGRAVPVLGVQEFGLNFRHALERGGIGRLGRTQGLQHVQVARRLGGAPEPRIGDGPVGKDGRCEEAGCPEVRTEILDAGEHVRLGVPAGGDHRAEVLVPHLERSQSGTLRQTVMLGVEGLGQVLAAELHGEGRHIVEAVIVRPRIAGRAELELRAAEGQRAAVEVRELHESQALDFPDTRLRGHRTARYGQQVGFRKQPERCGRSALPDQHVGLDRHRV